MNPNLTPVSRPWLILFSLVVAACSEGTADQVEMLDGRYGSTTVEELFDYRPGWGRPSETDSRAILNLMTARAPSLGP